MAKKKVEKKVAVKKSVPAKKGKINELILNVL